jgi:hypothetical protein
MGSSGKSFALILILIISFSSLSLLLIKPACAQSQSIPTPSVPEFSVKLADHSYDVPAIPPTSQFVRQTPTQENRLSSVLVHPEFLAIMSKT